MAISYDQCGFDSETVIGNYVVIKEVTKLEERISKLIHKLLPKHY